MTLHVVRAGPLTTVQDRGRRGLAHLGVARAGALDRPAADLANRLVGNAEDAAVLELTLGGLEVRATAGCWVAVTGALGPVTVDGAARGHARAEFVPAGATLRVEAGPRDDWFAAGALDLLCATTYTVAAESNRIGLRLDGRPLPRSRTDELPSEGMVLGAVQVPPDGRPVVFLADHPPTGGYPVIGVVRPDDLWQCAQLRPGDEVRFRRARAGSMGS